MNNFLTKQRAAMKSNKGFSMVELIIVIAIMVALVAVLAPQFLKYVESSRESADGTTVDSLVSAVQIALADPDVVWSAAGDLVYTIGTGAVTAPTPTTSETAVLASVDAAMGGQDKAIQSIAFGKGTGTATIKWDVNGSVSVDLSSAVPAVVTAWGKAVSVPVT